MDGAPYSSPTNTPLCRGSWGQERRQGNTESHLPTQVMPLQRSGRRSRHGPKGQLHHRDGAEQQEQCLHANGKRVHDQDVRPSPTQSIGGGGLWRSEGRGMQLVVPSEGESRLCLLAAVG